MSYENVRLRRKHRNSKSKPKAQSRSSNYNDSLKAKNGIHDVHILRCLYHTYHIIWASHFKMHWKCLLYKFKKVYRMDTLDSAPKDLS